MRFTDNGPGMEEEFQRTVFQDFVCYGEENRGSGLGLPLVQHIVTNMGGKMQLSSRLGGRNRCDRTDSRAVSGCIGL